MTDAADRARWREDPTPDRDGSGSLAVIGLSAAEEAAYEILVNRSTATVTELERDWRRPEPLTAILAALESKDLISRVPGTGARYAALPPEVALDALLTAADQRVRAVREHIDELAASYAGHRALSDAPVVERFTGARAIERRLAMLCRSARGELRWLAPAKWGQNSRDAVAVVRELTDRGVTCRGVYEREALSVPADHARIDQLTEAGSQIRIAESVPTVLFLVDRLAILALEWDGADITAAMVVHPGSVLDALDSLFEALWSGPATARWAESERLVDLLLSGGTDEAIARQLGVSYRTVVRRVAELMGELGARTRFQAGVQAALRDAAPPRDGGPGWR